MYTYFRLQSGGPSRNRLNSWEENTARKPSANLTVKHPMSSGTPSRNENEANHEADFRDFIDGWRILVVHIIEKYAGCLFILVQSYKVDFA